MFFSTSENPSQDLLSPVELLQAAESYTPSSFEVASTSFWTALDRTTGARAVEAYQLRKAEQDAITNGSTFRYLTESDWKASEDYIPGVEFRPGMTKAEGAILKANYDQRRQRERIMNLADENGNAWINTPLSFAAGMVGSLPDPINLAAMFVPGGPLVSSTGRIAGMTGRQVLRQSLRPTLIGEAAATNLAASAFSAWDLNAKGEDITMQDVLMDAAMGAVLAPMFSTAGTMISRTRARRGLRSVFTDLSLDLPEGSKVGELLNRMKANDPDAYRAVGDKLDSVLGATDRTQSALDFARNRITPAERLEFTRWMEFALTEVSQGRTPDIAPIAQGSSLLGKVEGIVNEYRLTQQEAPVVLSSLDAAKAELAAIDAAVAAQDTRLDTSLFRDLPEGHPFRKTTDAAKRASQEIRTVLRELTSLENERDATLARLSMAKERLQYAKEQHERFVDEGITSLLDDPYAQRYLREMNETQVELATVVTRAQDKVTEIEVQIQQFLGDTTPAASTRVDFSPLPVAREAELLPPPVSADSAINAETGLSFVEENLGPLSPEQQAELDAYTREGQRINQKERSAIEESRIAECFAGMGDLA